MYSPKIAEDLIPTLYRMAQKQKRPMTEVVDGILREKLKSTKNNKDEEDKTSKKPVNAS